MVGVNARELKCKQKTRCGRNCKTEEEEEEKIGGGHVWHQEYIERLESVI